jgi:hypothetical protein
MPLDEFISFADDYFYKRCLGANLKFLEKAYKKISKP